MVSEFYIKGRKMGQLGFVRFAIAIVVAGCMMSSAMDAALAAHKAKAQANPSSPDALYLHCRSVIFRKYGRSSGDGRRFIDRTRMVELADHCVRNGGRI